jgi:hypothetical protein
MKANSNILLTLIVLLLLSNCASPTAKMMQRGQVATPTFRDTIPFELREDLIVVRAQVNGKPMTMDFVWAPGALHSKLSKEAISYLGLEQYAAEHDGMVMVEQVTFGEVIFEDHAFEMTEYPLQSPARCVAEGGILGSNLLRNCNWIVDFDAQHILFMDKAQFESVAPEQKISFSPHKYTGTPLVKANITGYGKQEIAVDLGYSGALALPLQKVKNTAAGTRVYDEITQGILHPKADESYLLPSTDLQVGSWQSRTPSVLATSGEARMGNQIWQHYKVGLNFNTNELWLWPREGNYEPATAPSLGWLPKYDADGGLSVGYLLEGSPAWEAGLRAGDKVLVVDRRAAPAVFNDYCTYLFTVDERFGKAQQMMIQTDKMKQPVSISSQSR